MKRRTFLKHTLAASAAIAMGNHIRVAEAAGAMNLGNNGFKTSMMWGTVKTPGTILEKCKAVKAGGFDGIEPDSHMNRDEVIAAMKASGLVASSVCCSTHWKTPLSSPDANVRKEGVEGMIVALEDAKAYNTDAVLLVPGKVDDTVSYDDCWSRSTEEIKKLIPVAEKLKVKICIENVWNNFLLSPLEAARYVDQFNSKYVGSYFDIGNIQNYGWPDQWIKILGPRIFRIHIKEFSKEMADKEGRWKGFSPKLTEGDINWKKVMASIKEAKYHPWLTIEHHGGESPEGLKDLRQRLDKIIAS